MEQPETTTMASPTNLQIVLGAGAGAGLLALVLAALDRDEEQPTETIRVEPWAVPETPQSRGRQLLKSYEEALGAGSELARTVAEKAQSEVRDGTAKRRVEQRAREVTDQGRQSARAAADRLDVRSGNGRSEMAQRVGERAQRLSGQAATAVQSTAKQAAGVAETGVERARELGSKLSPGTKERWPQMSLRVGDQLGPVAQSVAGQVSGVASLGAVRAKEAGSVITTTAKERVPQLSQRVSSEVVPSLRDLAVQAASTALELWDTTRERAAGAAEAVQADLAPQAAQVVAAGGEKAREASAAVSVKAGEVGGRAKAASRHAADATVETSKDTGAMLFWGAAAGALIYYALLGPEERARLASSVQSITGQVQELIKDFQGYDEEF